MRTSANMPAPVKKVLNTIKKVKIAINPHPPVIVWQKGKVGSSSVYKSLKSSKIPNPVFHIHFLNPDNLDRIRKDLEAKNLSIPGHIDDGEILLGRYKKTGGNNWKIITIVRDLAKIKISGFFQYIERVSCDHEGLLTKNGDINTDLALQLLKKSFNNFDESKDYVCTWFDKEIKQMTKIDVFSHPFDHERGYTIIKENNVELLILKTELLNSTFNEAISRFLHIDFPLQLKNTNISKNKYYSEAINQVRNELVIPDEVLNKMNSSRYMRHFYPSKK